MGTNMLMSFFLVSLLVVSSTAVSAYATNDWLNSNHPPLLPTTASNTGIGGIRICGDHKCGPFEDVQKSLQDKLQHHQSIDVLKQNQTKIK
jgi:hypothetical protein